jgi:hypothetical protein
MGNQFKTPFCIINRYYKYLAMPFGMSNITVLFYSMVNEIFKDMVDLQIIVYINIYTDLYIN